MNDAEIPREYDAIIRRPIEMTDHYGPIAIVRAALRRLCRHCDRWVGLDHLYAHLLVCFAAAIMWSEIRLRRIVVMVSQGGFIQINQLELVEIMNDTLSLTIGRLRLLRNAGLFGRNIDEAAVRNVFTPRQQAPPPPQDVDPKWKWMTAIAVSCAVVVVIIGLVVAFQLGKHSAKEKWDEDTILVPGKYGGLAVAYLTGGPFGATLGDARAEVTFLLYRGKNEPIKFTSNDKNPLESFNASNALMVIIHGFNSHAERFGLPFSQAMAEIEPVYDLLVVDWESLAAAPFYLTAKTNAPVVGQVIAELLNTLIASEKATAARIRIVCHSLGCPVANYAAQNMEEMLERITGLDPASPLFDNPDESEVLDRSDAYFVDIIHSNGGHIWEFKLGMLASMGHADFRPNGGSSQPGCSKEWFGTCSHSRAIDLYVEFISNKDAFPSVACKSYVHFKKGMSLVRKQSNMGFHASNESHGNFYLDTRASAPYDLGSQG